MEREEEREVTCGQGDQVSVFCEKESFVPSGCTHHALGWAGGVTCPPWRQVVGILRLPTCYCSLGGTVTHKHHPHRDMTHFCVLQLKHHGGWSRVYENLYSYSQEMGPVGRSSLKTKMRVCVCVWVKVKCLHCHRTLCGRGEGVERVSVSRKHMREGAVQFA